MKKYSFLCAIFITLLLSIPGLAISEEIYHSLEEKKGAGIMLNISENVAMGGLVELEAGVVNDDMNGDSSDIVPATVEVGLDARINENVDSHILLLYEEEFTVDEGTITLRAPYGLVMTVGKMYVPFGVFNSHFISDPQTLELGETNESAILIGYGNDVFDISIGAFNGDFDDVSVGDNAGKDNKVDDYVAGVSVTPAEGITFGASYISDIADTDAEIGDGFYNVSATDPETYTAVYDDIVAGYSAFVSASFGPIAIEAEYLAAADEFDDTDLDGDGDGNGDQPVTFNIEVACAVSDALEVAARYEGNEDFFDMPETQYGLALAYELYENTVFALEYLSGEYENGDEVSSVTAQLAVEF